MVRHYDMQRVELYKKIADGTWTTTAVILDEAIGTEVRLGIGKIKDQFNFKLSNANNRFQRQYFSGNAVTLAFTIPTFFVPPPEFVNTDFFRVYVGGVLKTYTTDYTISGAIITFVSAPATGVDNIEVRYEVISSDDKITINFWRDIATWASLSANEKTAAFKIEGTITKPSVNVDDSTNSIGVNGIGFIESIFGSLAFLKPTAPAKWHVLVQQTISSINKLVPANKKIHGESTQEWTDLGNPTTKNDGSTLFPDISYVSSYKRGIEIIEDLTQDKYTGDGQYIYYVKKIVVGGNDKYGLFVRYKTQTPTSGNLFIEGTDNIESFSADRSVSEVVNAIIYNCGFDPYEKGMEYLNYNPASQSSLGSKWQYVTSTSDIGQSLVNREFEADKTKWNLTAAGGRKENFPKSAQYTWTFQFEGRDGSGGLTGAYKTAADDDAFSDAIRLEAKWVGKERTDRILKLYSNPKYTAEITLPPTDIALGEVYNLTLPSFAIHNEHPMRLMEVKYTINSTILTFEEDETVATIESRAL